jgi:hypothetical protein
MPLSKPKHGEPISSSHVHLSIRNGGHGELHGSAGIIAARIVAAGVQLLAEIGSVVGTQDRRAIVNVSIGLNEPEYAIAIAIG